MAAGHLGLLGDSIFDNARYVPGGSSVIDHLKRAIPKDWQATLLAVDGAVASDVCLQLKLLPSNVTHLAVSVGGNNALSSSFEMLHENTASAQEYMIRLAKIRSRFADEYRHVIDQVAHIGKPFALCTIYDSIPGLSPAEEAGLCLFNDVIVREGIRRRAIVIDLRLICTDSDDYSKNSPIEPSSVGGKKIARGLVHALVDGPIDGGAVAVFGA